MKKETGSSLRSWFAQKSMKRFLYHVPAKNGLALHVLQAELADVKAAEPGVLLWVRRVVPGVQFVTTEQNGFDHVAAFSDLSLHAQLLLDKSNHRIKKKNNCIKSHNELVSKND